MDRRRLDGEEEDEGEDEEEWREELTCERACAAKKCEVNGSTLPYRDNRKGRKSAKKKNKSTMLKSCGCVNELPERHTAHHQ